MRIDVECWRNVRPILSASLVALASFYVSEMVVCESE